MRTRSQARKRRQQQVRQTSVESPNLEKPNNNQETFNPPIVTMADNRTMAQLLEAPTEGYEDAIVVPEITANNFEIKHGLLNLVQNKQFFGHDKEDPMPQIRYFNKIHLLRMKVPNVNQPPAYQAPVPQTHGVSKTDFDNYVKANDAGSGTLPGNTVTNPKEDLKGITTRSGVAYQGPTSSSSPKYSLRLSFEISFTDALTLMPKFASTLKTLIGNKEELSEMARTPLNENCSTVILNKLPKKIGDPGRFLIPCEFSRINKCNALADLGASINLMPYFVWKDLSLPELTLTCMTLELADCSITEPIGIAKDVRLMVGKFQFPADFVVVDFKPNPRVPLILRRSFLKTSRALIDVYEGEITLRVGKETITFNLDQTSRYTANYNHMTANRIDVIELACEDLRWHATWRITDGVLCHPADSQA
ncbi:reverse transcriptase domain-containing protein [Tanacetum coccineum]